MPGVLHRLVGAAVGDQRIARVALERPLRGPRPGDRHRVAALGAALGDEQVPPVADAVEVRTLGELAAGARPEPAALGQHLAGQRVDRRLDDALAALRPEARVGHQAGAVVVPRQVGVDAHRRRDAHRLRPRPGRVVGVHEELSAVVRPVRGDHPEPAVVVAQRRGEDPAGGAGLRDVELRRAGPARCRSAPTSAGRSSGRSARRARTRSWRCQVVGVADPADAGVGVEAGENRPLHAHARPSHGGRRSGRGTARRARARPAG